MFSLTFGRHQKAGQHAMAMRSLGRAGAEANFSKNHHISQRLLGLIVSGLDIRVFEASKKPKVFLIGVEQSFSQGIWGRVFISDYSRPINH